jgi:hypothetical protein
MGRLMLTYEIQFHGREKVEQLHLEGEGLLAAFQQFGQDQKEHGVWVGEVGGGVKIAVNLGQILFLRVKPRQQTH